jgi:hypothetical protein
MGRALLLPKLVEPKPDIHESLKPSDALKEMAKRYGISLRDIFGAEKSSAEIIRTIDLLNKDEWMCPQKGDNWEPGCEDDVLSGEERIKPYRVLYEEKCEKEE